MRPLLLASAICVAWPVAGYAQSASPPLAPLPAPAPSQPPALPPAPPAAPTPQPEAPVDLASSPPVVVDATPPPPAAAAEASAPGPCGGKGAFEHDGFYLRVASGAGFLSFSGQGPGGDASLSGLSSSSMVAIGGTPGRGFVLGGTIASESITNPSFTNSPTTVQHGWTATGARLGAFADWFPSEHRGGHVGALFALNVASLTNDGADINWAALGWGAEVFGGYDFWIGPEWSLGIQGGLSFSPTESLKDKNGDDSGYSMGTFAFALQGTLLYH